MHYDIDLVLPDIYPYNQIGRTIRISFPTWRDCTILRKIRDSLDGAERLSPGIVSASVRTNKAYLAKSEPSLNYNFDRFDKVSSIGGDEYPSGPLHVDD